jgi:hypothetical protein
MRLLVSMFALLLAACGQAEYRTTDPQHGKSDAGTGGFATDAGTGGGTGGGLGGGTGGGATGGGTGGGGTGGGGTGGGGATGGGTGGGGGTTCGPQTCASGCCSSGQCVAGTSATACGTGGATCTSCQGADSCAQGTCQVDPSSRWLVRPSSMDVEPGFDLTSPADVEVGLWCPATESSVTAIMTKVQDSDSPTWSSGGCTMTAADLLATGFDFDALDIDGTGADVISDRVHVPVSAADLSAGSLTGSTTYINSVTIVFIKQ